MARATGRRAGTPIRGDAGIGGLETLFKALGDRTRLRILGLLIGGEVCVCDIHESLRIPQPRASRHLAYLRRAGLVEARKKGLWVHYRLAPAADAAVGAILDAVGHGLRHAPAIDRDRRRLHRRTGCCAPLRAVISSTFACCRSPADPAELKFRPTSEGVSASTSGSPPETADAHPHSPGSSSSGESSG
jgi:ArsR family transcriptional regulator